MLRELDLIERRHGGPVDRVAFYRHVARVALRDSRYRKAAWYYAHAAARADLGYIRRGFLLDLVGVGRQASTRLGGGNLRTVRSRVRAKSDPNAAWREQAQPWLTDLVRELRVGE
jgi:hypothetical protein